MNNVLVSVIVPVYNVEKYIAKCIESIISQTYANIEIILINDGSMDKSGKICKKYALQDSRIKVVDDTNHGVSHARNEGIKLAKGKYIVFIDSDDRVDKEYIQSLIEPTYIQEYDLVICSFREIFEYSNKTFCHVMSEEEKENLTGKLNIDYKILEKFLGIPWLKLYRTDIIKKYNITFPEDLKIAEDQIFNYAYLEHVKKYYFINKTLYNYNHRNDNSLTNVRDHVSFICDIKNLKKRKIFLEKINVKEKDQILGDLASGLVHIYAFVKEKSNNNYSGFKYRANELRRCIPINYEPKTMKKYLMYKLLKHKCFLVIYFYNYVKHQYDLLKRM